MTIDYAKVGLKAGLEIHQQLDTSEKLFCSCKPELLKEEPEITFLRRLRPTQSELGQVDPAAFFEFQKGVEILYEASKETSCLVEMDEEPPHNLNSEAVEVSLIISLMMGAKPVDEIHVMRKTVIDGSNTTGFQRTCITALNGELTIDGKPVPIQHVSLEEDAARKMGEERSTIRYRIDRLGIPLVEVTTGPVFYSPKEAEKAASTIGQILRATGRVRRGLGTIRQDLNVSIRDGALIEIKGIQELELVSKAIDYEVQRQLNLLKIRDHLRKLKASQESIKDSFVNATSIFKQTKSKLIQKALSKSKEVWAVKLPNFAGLLGAELAPSMRLGLEMAECARFWGRAGGIFHTDEMPNYGITVKEVNQLVDLLKAEPNAAVVFVADYPSIAQDALKAVAERAREAFKGVPEETRAANPDGTTRYMRPRPGAARMYPETDVTPIKIEEDYIEKLRDALPELPEEKMNRFMDEYGLNQKVAGQILDSEYVHLFETIACESSISPTVIAVSLTDTMKALRRDGIETVKLKNEQIKDIFRFVDGGKTTKEAIPDILTWLSKHEESRVEEALKSLGLGVISPEELEIIIAELIKTNIGLVEKKGMGALDSLMGIAMKKCRGRAKPEMVSETLRRIVAELVHCP